MLKARLHFLLLNVGHFLDHLVMLVFATVAALVLRFEWGLSYAELIAYATPGFVAFGIFSLPAGWLADRWSREGMMVVYFLGIGVSSIACALAEGPVQMAVALFAVGMFAAIYHPVGLTLVVDGAKRTGMALALNGIWGNLGVGGAALLTGIMIDTTGWPSAFFWPGIVSIGLGLAYLALMWTEVVELPKSRRAAARANGGKPPRKSYLPEADRDVYLRITMIVLYTTGISALVFQSVTFAMPKIFEERLTGIAETASMIGWVTFIVAAIASLAQLVVGHLLDTAGPRTMFLFVAGLQAVCFMLMPGLDGWWALVVAMFFVTGSFGQLPINDYIIGKTATPERRASIYGARFVLTFSVLALALPLIGWIHANWGFDMLFRLLAVTSASVFIAASMLPHRVPEPSVAPPPAAPAE
ncbi:MAG: MFS transporter [Alphaproteobacteria bacterium]|nr:MFS transporter [Alphaproteobacteria bacterium]